MSKRKRPLTQWQAAAEKLFDYERMVGACDVSEFDPELYRQWKECAQRLRAYLEAHAEDTDPDATVQ